MNEPATIATLLRAKTIAVIGLSDDPAKPSHYVSAAMQRLGHRILPVNPGFTSALGEVCYPSLTALPILADLGKCFPAAKVYPGHRR